MIVDSRYYQRIIPGKGLLMMTSPHHTINYFQTQCNKANRKEKKILTITWHLVQKPEF